MVTVLGSLTISRARLRHLNACFIIAGTLVVLEVRSKISSDNLVVIQKLILTFLNLLSLIYPYVDVDDGSTVTDFLPAERARGITIQSAAVTFHWPPLHQNMGSSLSIPIRRSQISHTINLIDTPGHADFTFEVLRSLRVLDGAVCILDGVAGVEAQTEKVWAQANNYSIPRIIYVNKLDRIGASFGRTVKEIASKLHGWPAVCQIPWWEDGKGRFTGVGDAINLCALKWEYGNDGKNVRRFSLEELAGIDDSLVSEIKKARAALVDILCEFDDKLLGKWLELGDDSMAVPSDDIIESLRQCVLDGSGRLIPVFAGASFRNIGVQPLLDAVNDLLPDPTERPDPEVSLGQVHVGLTTLLDGKANVSDSKARHVGKLSKVPVSLVANIEACALAFKVVHDPRRGALVYIRVYHGSIRRNAPLWNTNLHVTERAQRLLQMSGSDAIDISNIPAGQIGVIAGLKYARTGDTLMSYPKVNPKTGPPVPLSCLQLRPITIPPPVFFAAIEPNSLSEEKNVADNLATILREDPSLHFHTDEESGQMLLSGMGELHLEIARDRLINDFKAKAAMSSIKIGYRECVLSDSNHCYFLYDREIAGKRGKAGCEAILGSTNVGVNSDKSVHRNGNTITIYVNTSCGQSPEQSVPLPPNLPLPALREALINGVLAALARGPRKGFPIHSSHVKLTFNTVSDLFGTDTTPSALASAARMAVRGALKEALTSGSIGLMEPVMSVVISCDETSLGAVVHDLSSARGGHILSLGEDNYATKSNTELQVIDAGRVYTPPDPFPPSSSGVDSIRQGQQRQITARVPLREMVGYLKHLRNLTGGRGTFIMSIDRFERLSSSKENTI